VNTRLTAAVAAGALAIGVLTGAAGSIAIGNDSAARQHEQMGSMMEMMAGSDMGSMMGGSDAMGPGPGAHDAHHPDSDQ
jgi:hypothetical protein